MQYIAINEEVSWYQCSSVVKSWMKHQHKLDKMLHRIKTNVRLNHAVIELRIDVTCVMKCAQKVNM